MLWPSRMLQMASRRAGCKSLPLQAWVAFESWLKEDKGLGDGFDLYNTDRAGQERVGRGGGARGGVQGGDGGLGDIDRVCRGRRWGETYLHDTDRMYEDA